MESIEPHPFFMLSGASWRLTFSDDALALIRKSTQRSWWQKESVGQLFTRSLAGGTVVIDLATKLKPKWSSWAGVAFDVDAAMAERELLFKAGLHCVGLWHSHPEAMPSPSGPDILLAKDHGQAAQSVLSGLVFTIVGNKPYPGGWYVGLHDGRNLHQMTLDMR